MLESLDEFFARHDWARIEAATGWHVRRDTDDGDRVLISITASDGERYTVLCLCDGYSKRAPSVTFVNDRGEKSDAAAWPKGNAEFFREVKPPPNCFLCMPLTREGLQHHPVWTSRGLGWSPNRHTLLDIFNRLQRLVAGPNYQGRGGTP